ncbi:MAG: hypothetical protein JWR69_2323, partial [Pedosphaera sp.]|nr:hypothetical protein [Pedosphaera sp.]
MRGLKWSLLLRVGVWLGMVGTSGGAYADAPVITAITPRGSSVTELTVTNCSDANFNQIIQLSTNLQDWSTITTYVYSATSPGENLKALVPATNEVCFYRAVSIPWQPRPLFGFAIATHTNFNANGKNILVDSFDSGDPSFSTYVTNAATGSNGVWMYNPAKGKAGGDVATRTGVAGSFTLGNMAICGHLYTGPGNQSNVVQMGPYGTVGDLAWRATNTGIEGNGTFTNWWQQTFSSTFPAVAAPTWVGNALPSVTTTGPYAGYIVIPQAGANSNYAVSILPSTPLYVVGPAQVWVKGSASLGVIIATTNGARLTLYVGTTTGIGDSITLAGNNNTVLNQPGYARKLQIFGLPSLTSLDLHGNAGWTACIYAPNTDIIAGAGGNNVQDCTGAV